MRREAFEKNPDSLTPKTNEIRVQSIQFGILSSPKTMTEKELKEKKRACREAFKQIIDREDSNDKKKSRKCMLNSVKRKRNERLKLIMNLMIMLVRKEGIHTTIR